MRAGHSPQEACLLAVQRVEAAAARRGRSLRAVAFLALDLQGRVGAAGTSQANFFFAVGRLGKIDIGPAWEPSQGNAGKGSGT